MRSRIALVLVLGVAACDRASRAPTSSPPDAGESRPTTSVPAPSSGTVPPVAPSSPALLGLAPRATADDEAEKANNAGFRAHAKSQYGESRDAFTKAVSRDPDFTMARYNLACALARLGDLDGAERELGRVLAEDLPTYRRGLEHDDDLAPVRASAEHIGRLRALVPRLEASYRAALAHGLRAILWAPSKASRWGSNPAQRSVAQPSVLRIGVFDPKTKRFFPVAPSLDKPLAALWGTESPYAVALTGAWNPNCGGDLCQWIEGVTATLFDVGFSGEPLTKIVTKGQSQTSRAEWSESELRFDVFFAFEPVANDNGTFLFGWTPKAGLSKKRFDPGSASSPLKTPGSAPRIRAELDHPFGVSIERSAANVSWDAKARALKLASGEAVPLFTAAEKLPAKRPPTQFALSPTGRKALVVWDTTTDCDSDHHPEMTMSHVTFLVDFDTKTAKKLTDQRGVADAAFDADGNAYVQADAVLSHVDAASFALDPLPKDVLLSPVALHQWQCVGFW